MKLKPFQKDDLARAALHDGLVLSWDTGLGKTLAAYLWPLLKVGYDRVEGAAGWELRPRQPVLLVAPGDLHDQMTAEAWRQFRIRPIPLDSQETWSRLSSGGRISPGFYLTSYTQLATNGVPARPDPDRTDPLTLLGMLGFKETREPGADPAVPVAADFCSWDYSSLNRFNRDVVVREFVRYHLEMTWRGVGEERVAPDGRVIRCLGSPSLADLCADAFAVVVVDEGVRMKGARTLIGRGVRQMRPKYRLVLTATPIKNRVPDLFWLAWWAAGGLNRAHARWPYAASDQQDFADTFLVSERNVTREERAAAGGRRRINRATAEVCNIHLLWKLCAPVILRRRKTDAGEPIVPKHRQVIRVPLGSHQSAVYQAHLEARYLDGTGLPAVAAKLQALRLVAADPTSPLLTGRYLRRGPARSPHAYTPKLSAALNLIGQILEQGEQVIVFGAFHDSLDVVSRHLAEAGVLHEVLDGRVSQKRRGAAAARFKLGPAGGIPVLLAGVESMAEGHSFHLCPNVILLAYSWAYDKFEQAINRVHRLNSARPVQVYSIICEGSIDRRLEECIREKATAVDLALDGRLQDERTEEVSLADLLRIAEKEFTREGAVDETVLVAEWPKLRQKLAEAASKDCAQRNAL